MAISPRPPAPRAPAIAEYPRMVPITIVQPTSKDVFASGRRTFKIIVFVEAPILKAASITPGSTSNNEDSIIRAT